MPGPMFVALWARDTAVRTLNQDGDARLLALMHAAQAAWDRFRATPRAYAGDVRAIFLAPEYLFANPREIADAATTTRAIPQPHKRAMVELLGEMSADFPGMLFIPGTIIYSLDEAAYPVTFRESRDKALGRMEELQRGVEAAYAAMAPRYKKDTFRNLAPAGGAVPPLAAKIDRLRSPEPIHYMVRNKMYVFLNTWHVTPAERDAIHARLRRNGATAVWVYAPGFIGDKASVENMRALTGIRLAESNTAGELHVKTKDLDYGTDVNVANIKRWYDHQVYLKDPRDPGLQRDLPGFRVSPRFYADDPGAQVLGTLTGLDKPGLVMKKQQGWTSIYSAAPILPAALLRNLARSAGVHIYSDAGDVVYADRNYVSIYAPTGGKRTVHLRQSARVTDAVAGKVIAESARDFPLEMAPNSTVILRVEGNR